MKYSFIGCDVGVEVAY